MSLLVVRYQRSLPRFLTHTHTHSEIPLRVPSAMLDLLHFL